MRPYLLIPLLLATGCGSGSPKNAPPAPTPGPSTSTTGAAPSTDPADTGALTAGANQLAMSLYGRLKETPGNLVFSPASMHVALTMTWGGARGETAAEMGRVLGVAGAEDQVLAAAGAQIAAWNDPSRTARTLAVANRLFGDQGYTFNTNFVARTKDLFAAPLEALDFAHQHEAGRARINQWVKEQTRERIQDLLPQGSVDDQTRLVLVNAIYLLAKWESPFEATATSPQPFYAGPTPKPVPTMYQAEMFRYGAADGAAILEMPYEGGDLSMVIVLPDARDGLPALESSLDASKLARWIERASVQRVRVWLPKFKVEPGEPVRMKEHLEALGMKRAFDRQQADFTGIANPPDPDDRLFISQVFHKAFIAVDEAGTEAAAATAVVMARAGSAPPSTPPPEFRADHPFLFFLRDTRTGVILFAGRVADPS